MKDYSKYPRHSISMSSDKKFIETIGKVFDTYNIKNIVECGTFKGTGSTRTIANIIKNKQYNIEKFYTIEVDYDFYKQAVKNLRKFKFVYPIWGISVDKELAIDFVINDDAIKNHEKYPDVYIDILENPAEFYLNELNGKLSEMNRKKSFFEKLFARKNKNNEIFKNNILEEILPQIKNEDSLILLDSAGGIGFLEFKTVLEELKDSNFILILDDIHHLKHFRSIEYVQNSEKFNLIQKSELDGWAIAYYQGKK